MLKNKEHFESDFSVRMGQCLACNTFLSLFCREFARIHNGAAYFIMVGAYHCCPQCPL